MNNSLLRVAPLYWQNELSEGEPLFCTRIEELEDHVVIHTDTWVAVPDGKVGVVLPRVFVPRVRRYYVNLLGLTGTYVARGFQTNDFTVRFAKSGGGPPYPFKVGDFIGTFTILPETEL